LFKYLILAKFEPKMSIRKIGDNNDGDKW